jgi:hypothetical protein
MQKNENPARFMAGFLIDGAVSKQHILNSSGRPPVSVISVFVYTIDMPYSA